MSALFTSDVSTNVSVYQLMLTLACAFLSGFIISLTYIKTNRLKGHSENFALTIILLPAVIASIIMLIGSDVAKAFSLAGAFSIIRFRSAPGEPKDIAFVLFVMAAGLAAGVGAYVYAVAFTGLLCLMMLLLDHFEFGRTRHVEKALEITIPEDLNYEDAFEPILDQYTRHHHLRKVKTTAMGSLYKLTYEVTLDEGLDTKAFLDTLRTRNGNLAVCLMIQASD